MLLRQLPNVLTLTRAAAAPVLVWLIINGRIRQALGLILVAGLTDWLDGYTARKFGVSGQTGVILDPLADKLLLVTLFLVLGFVGLIPVWLLALVMGRDLVIVGGALLLRLFRNIRRFRPSMLGKVSTFFQIVFVLLVLLSASFPSRIFAGLQLGAFVLTTFFTALSGLDYIRQGIQMARQPPLRDG